MTKGSDINNIQNYLRTFVGVIIPQIFYIGEFELTLEGFIALGTQKKTGREA